MSNALPSAEEIGAQTVGKAVDERKNEQSAAIPGTKRRANRQSRSRAEERAIRCHPLSNTARKPW